MILGKSQELEKLGSELKVERNFNLEEAINGVVSRLADYYYNDLFGYGKFHTKELGNYRIIKVFLLV